MSRDKLSSDSLREATRSRAEYSGHGDAIGSAGYREGRTIGMGDCESLSEAGQTKAVNAPENGFGPIHIGLSWNNVVTEKAGFFDRLLKKALQVGVDLDLGCLYELKNGERGCLQSFGEKFGDYNTAPFIALSGDERTGDAEGDDEVLRINGPKWGEIERVLVYCYIYRGPTQWHQIQPNLSIAMSGEMPVRITPTTHRDDVNIVALAKIENTRGGLTITNHTEYFHDHAAMDRAFGFGIEWGDGHKK